MAVEAWKTLRGMGSKNLGLRGTTPSKTSVLAHLLNVKGGFANFLNFSFLFFIILYFSSSLEF